MKNCIYIAHPVLQHSHQLAWALYEQGLLQEFCSGTPVKCAGEQVPKWIPKNYADKIKQVEIPKTYRKHPLIFQILLKSGTFLPKCFSRDDYAHRIFHLFDWWVSKQIKKTKPKVVIAFENSAYHTFKAAKEIGAKCVLEAPSFHHTMGEKLLIDQASNYRPEINRRKDKEVELADLIITCSPLAAESYIEQGVNPEKIKPMLLGANLPLQTQEKKYKQDKTIKFVFAGVLSYRKSTDLILNVFQRLNQEGFNTEITLIGGIAEPKWQEKIKQAVNAHHHPNVSQAELYKLYSQADCLLLPSRFDSFGMVVPEAMACGIPAIVSTQTGSKAIIEQFPKSGWIIETTEELLYQCIKQRIQTPQALAEAGKFAYQAAEHFTWAAYRGRVGTVFNKLLNT